MWYKFWAHHGPGHQSSTEWYEWHSRKLHKSDIEYIFEQRFAHSSQCTGWHKIVRRLPAKVRMEKIERILDRRERDVAMLKRLGYRGRI